MGRIMGGAHCIDVVLLHQIQIRQHVLFCNTPSCIFIPVVPVYAFQFDSLSVYQEQAVLQTNVSETGPFTVGFQNFSLSL